MPRLPTPRLLDGPAPALPRPLDALSERWWALPARARALALALATTLLLLALVADLGRSSYGPPVTVTVAAEDLPAGHELAPGDLTVRRWPADLAPETVAPQATGTLLGPVAEDTPVATDLVGEGGMAALATDGHAVVSLPASLLPVRRPGTRLDLVAPGPDGGTRVLATSARVLRTDEHHVHVEVAADGAADVAAAGHRETLVAVLRTP